MLFDEVLAEVVQYRTPRVTVTGGEPLAQPACRDLLVELCDGGFDVSLETGGAMDIGAVDSRVTVVMDMKTPGSGEQSKNRYENLGHLRPKDQIKFVIVDRADYEWAKMQLATFKLSSRCEVLLSPSHGALSPGVLGEWILEDRLQVRLQIQLHKYLWGDGPGR
jgi:7-carboxy-7-deazaguanine synthase